MYPVWPVWMGSSIPVAVWLYPRLSVITLQDLLPALLSFGSGHSGANTEGFAQAAAGYGESGATLGPGDQEKGEREKRPKEEMNPRSFPNTRGALSEEEPEAVNMRLDSPDSPEEVEANARSPSPDLDYEPDEEAEMLLDQAEAVEVKVDRPDYVPPGSRSPTKGLIPSPITVLFSQVCAAGTDPQVTPSNLEESRKRREEEVRRARARSRILDQARGSPEAKDPGLTFKDPLTPGRRSRTLSEELICICKLCKLYPVIDCDVNWPRQVMAQRKGATRKGRGASRRRDASGPPQLGLLREKGAEALGRPNEVQITTPMQERGKLGM